MKKMNAIMVPMLFALSAQAFAWKGNGSRPPEDPKIPADTSHSKKTQTDSGDIIIEGSFSNRYGTKDLICDVFGSVQGARGPDLVTVTNFVDKRLVRAYRAFSDRFFFSTSEAGPGYSWLKGSQHYEYSCLSLDPGEDPGQVPPPHDKCDPEYQDCDWSCKSGPNPDQCESPSQDWPES